MLTTYVLFAVRSKFPSGSSRVCTCHAGGYHVERQACCFEKAPKLKNSFDENGVYFLFADPVSLAIL